jgi:hypothetical protein
MNLADAGAVHVALALSVLLEAELAAGAVVEAGCSTSDVGGYDAGVARLSAAQADYLDVVARRSESRHPGLVSSLAEVVPVPLRLLPFSDPDRLRSAVRRDLEQALSWEEQAMRSGRTLTEWVLVQALMARCPA